MPRSELPSVDLRLCTACGDCVEVCPTECLALVEEVEVVLTPPQCISCGVCEVACPVSAIAMVPGDW